MGMPCCGRCSRPLMRPQKIARVGGRQENVSQNITGNRNENATSDRKLTGTAPVRRVAGQTYLSVTWVVECD